MIWSQRWSDVLFIHYPAQAAELDPHLPPGVELDLFDDQAWISFVFFRLHVRLAWLPAVPGFSSLLELNLRTYVRCRGEQGIYFLSMHADNRLAILVAKLLTPLPYVPACMALESDSTGLWRAECDSAENSASRLCVQFRPGGPAATVAPGSLDAWLLERYRLFMGGRNRTILAADVDHAPWHVFRAEIIECADSIAADSGVLLDENPAAAHFSPGLTARFGSFWTLRLDARRIAQIATPARATVRHGGR